MINLALFTPRNFLIVGIFSVIALTLASRIFKGVETPSNSEDE